MSAEAQKYLDSASQKIKAGKKKDAEADLDLAEIEIDMLSDEDAVSFKQQLTALKNALNSTEIDPEKREGVLSSLQRRAENVKIRLQSKDTAKHEIADFESFLNREENLASLTPEDIAQFNKQIAGFQKLSAKYAMEEVITDIRYILNSFEQAHQEVVNACEQGDQYAIDSAVESAERTGRRFEDDIKDFKENEEVQPLIASFEEIKRKIGKALKANTEKEQQAEEALHTQAQAEEEQRKQAEQASADAFLHLPTAIPPMPIQDAETGKLLGRIIFSDAPIVVGKENLSAIKNTFKAGEQVFGMAYFPDTRKNIGFERGVRMSIRDIEDGRGYTTSFTLIENFVYEPDNQNALGTTYDLDIFVSHQDAWDKELTAHLLQFLSLHLKHAPQSPYGDNSHKVHRLQVEMEVGYETVARGEFLYDLTTRHDEIHKLYATHTNAHLKAFKLPESKRQDDALAEKLRQVMIAQGVNVQKVVFSTADWGIIRHELSGAVLRRSIWAYIVYENEKGEYHYDDVQFTEEFVGNDFNGIIRKAGYGTAHGQILPENI